MLSILVRFHFSNNPNLKINKQYNIKYNNNNSYRLFLQYFLIKLIINYYNKNFKLFFNIKAYKCYKIFKVNLLLLSDYFLNFVHIIKVTYDFLNYL